jgi:phosphoglycerate dehydrogenase-like enzyme
MDKILITPRSLTRDGHPALQRLQQSGYQLVFCTPGVQPGAEELRRLLPDCVGYLAGVETVSADVLEAATRLRVISRNGVGVDNIDLEAARRRGLRIVCADTANSRGVAELTMALLLGLARLVPLHDARLRSGAWQRELGMELEGSTLGIVGLGRIGRLVAQLARGLGIRVRACDPQLRAGATFDGCPLVTPEQLLSSSDCVSLHCPPAPDHSPMINVQSLGGMRHGSLLINTARAALVDLDAVLAALESGQLRGFATDVFDEEPPRDHPLFHHPCVILTPHLGGFTRQSVDRAVAQAVNNLIAALVLSGPGAPAAAPPEELYLGRNSP